MLHSLRLFFEASSAWWLVLRADGSLRDLKSTCPVPARVRSMLAAECAASDLPAPHDQEAALRLGQAAALVPKLRPALHALGLESASSVWASWRDADRGGVHVGALREAPFADRAAERLRELLPLLRAAMRDELENAPLRAALSDALERLEGPAFVLGEDDRIAAMNADGEALLADPSLEAAASVARAAAGLDNPLGLVLRERLVVQARPSTPPEKLPAFARKHGLSPRHTVVLELLCQGLRNSEIAARLGLARITVEQHVTGMFRRTNTRSRTELVARALGREELTAGRHGLP